MRHDVEFVEHKLVVRPKVPYEERLFMRPKGVSPRFCIPAKELWDQAVLAACA